MSIWERRARRAGKDEHGGGCPRRRSGSRFALLLALLGAAAALTLTGPATAPAHPAARTAATNPADEYYVLLLTNVEDNVYVGSEASLASEHSCDLPDGGPSPCTTAITYTVQLGPYPTCAAATAAYNAAAMNPHPAFGGTKVYIFGGSYFIDDMSYWCTPGSGTTTGATTTTTSSQTSSGGESSQAPPLPTQFCVLRTARAAAAGSVCAPTKTLSPDEKDAAREELRSELTLAVIFCGGPVSRFRKGVSARVGRALLDYLLDLCPTIVEVMGDTLNQVHDPPLPSYRQVALIIDRSEPPPPTITCPSSVSAGACAAIRTGSATYAAAAKLADEIAASASLTTDRFAAAVAAHSVRGAFLQSAVGAYYAGAIDGSLLNLQTAGAALGAAYTSAGLDFTVPAAAATSSITAASSTVLTPALLGQLVADGVAATPAAARAAIVAELDTASGTIDGASALAGQLPAVPFATVYFAMTLSDLRAMVNGLAAQGTLEPPAARTLNAELTRAHEGCGKPAFAAAMRSFTATAGKSGAGAETILPYAARPLLESTVTSAACA